MQIDWRAKQPSQAAWNVELESLPAGTKPRTSHHRSPGGGERRRHYLRAQSQGHHTIDRLEERGVERGSSQRSSLWEDKKGPSSIRPTLNCFKGNIGETPERLGVAHMGFPERIYRPTILNWTELNWTERRCYTLLFYRCYSFVLSARMAHATHMLWAEVFSDA